MDAVLEGRVIGAARLAIGVGMVVAPRTAVAGWIGPAADAEGTKVLTRAFGAREVLLGFLQAHVASRPGVGRRTFGAIALCDVVDLVSTVAARKHLPASGVAMISVLAGAGALSQAKLATTLPEA